MIVELASQYGRYGYRRIGALLRRRGWAVNHKRVERIWRQEGLRAPQKQPKRSRLWLNDGSCVRLRPQRRNHVWAYDFVFTRTHDGRSVRLLTVIDEYTRECLAIRAERSIKSVDVIETLAGLMLRSGVPEHIRSDNGPGVYGQGGQSLAWPGGSQHALHRARLAVGERLCGEFQRQAAWRTVGPGDLLHASGGAGADWRVQADLQPHPAAQLAGLPAAGAGGYPAC